MHENGKWLSKWVRNGKWWSKWVWNLKWPCIKMVKVGAESAVAVKVGGNLKWQCVKMGIDGHSR